ncbi:hypothetical protein PAXRUDRAFT_80268, partial [Paxillus rubicundulus Ve08.2h10]
LHSCIFKICGKQPGKNWARCFIQHCPHLVSAKPHGLDPKRAQNFNRKTIEEYFQLRGEVEEKYNGIPPEHNWNMDEKGNQLGGGRKGSGMKFIFWTENKEHYCLHCDNDNLKLGSILECVNAAGTAMPPCFVMKEGPLADHSDIEGIGLTNINYLTRIAMLPNGSINQVLCKEWFRDTFVPNALACRVNEKPIVLNTNGRACLLLVDGHNSHYTKDFLDYAWDHNIHVLCYPAHSTHVYQGLDVVVFSPLKCSWTEECDHFENSKCLQITKQNFISVYGRAHCKVLTPELICTAFKKMGVWP